MPNHNKPSSSIRTETTPVLVKRTAGEIEVWDQTPEYRDHVVPDALGGMTVRKTVIVQSQKQHENGGYWKKEIPVEYVGAEHQDYLAEILAADRPQMQQVEQGESTEASADDTVERKKFPTSHGYEMICANPRLRTLYSVEKRPTDDEVPLMDYGKALGPNRDEEHVAFVERERKRIQLLQENYDRYHTPEARRLSEIATENLRNFDPTLKSLLDTAIGGDIRHKVDTIANNADMRLIVAGYLLDKLKYLVKEYPTEMPERIVRNGGKRTDAKPMPVNQYNSQEYTVYLALEILSGGYEPDRGARDPIEYDSSGRAIRGQHREAAGWLVGYR